MFLQNNDIIGLQQIKSSNDNSLVPDLFNFTIEMWILNHYVLGLTGKNADINWEANLNTFSKKELGPTTACHVILLPLGGVHQLQKLRWLCSGLPV